MCLLELEKLQEDQLIAHDLVVANQWPYSRSGIPIKNNFRDFKITILLDF
jgi:hypothetical protein